MITIIGKSFSVISINEFKAKMFNLIASIPLLQSLNWW